MKFKSTLPFSSLYVVATKSSNISYKSLAFPDFDNALFLDPAEAQAYIDSVPKAQASDISYEVISIRNLIEHYISLIND